MAKKGTLYQFQDLSSAPQQMSDGWITDYLSKYWKIQEDFHLFEAEKLQ